MNAMNVIHRSGKISWRARTTWNASTDPNLIVRMHRVPALYDTAPAGGRVICVDEFGPLDLQPRQARARRPGGKPHRLRATCDRYGGVMHMLAALDGTDHRTHEESSGRFSVNALRGMLRAGRGRP
ncbi:hypothetical protein [Streptomyces sp. MMBL 11-3]|uniref:hypothetical protein n=1 Tax=Streptomyces sp. MMBL 11-3 TaxID=3382639 RepID=UPI0039B44A0E